MQVTFPPLSKTDLNELKEKTFSRRYPQLYKNFLSEKDSSTNNKINTLVKQFKEKNRFIKVISDTKNDLLAYFRVKAVNKKQKDIKNKRQTVNMNDRLMKRVVLGMTDLTYKFRTQKADKNLQSNKGEKSVIDPARIIKKGELKDMEIQLLDKIHLFKGSGNVSVNMRGVFGKIGEKFDVLPGDESTLTIVKDSNRYQLGKLGNYNIRLGRYRVTSISGMPYGEYTKITAKMMMIGDNHTIEFMNPLKMSPLTKDSFHCSKFLLRKGDTINILPGEGVQPMHMTIEGLHEDKSLRILSPETTNDDPLHLGSYHVISVDDEEGLAVVRKSSQRNNANTSRNTTTITIKNLLNIVPILQVVSDGKLSKWRK